MGRLTAVTKSDLGWAAREGRLTECQQPESIPPSQPNRDGPGPADVHLPYPGKCDHPKQNFLLVPFGTVDTAQVSLSRPNLPV